MALGIDRDSRVLPDGDRFRVLSSRPHRFADTAEGEMRLHRLNCL